MQGLLFESGEGETFRNLPYRSRTLKFLDSAFRGHLYVCFVPKGFFNYGIVLS